MSDSSVNVVSEQTDDLDAFEKSLDEFLTGEQCDDSVNTDQASAIDELLKVYYVMADRLPEELKNRVLMTQDLCNKTIAKIMDPSLGLNPQILIFELLNGLISVLDDQEDVFLNIAFQIEAIIKNPTFLFKLQSGQFDDELIDKLLDVQVSVEVFIKRSNLSQDLLDKVCFFNEIILKLIDSDVAGFFGIFAQRAKIENLKAKGDLNSIISDLDKFLQTSDITQEQVEAVSFWKLQTFEPIAPFLNNIFDENGEVVFGGLNLGEGSELDGVVGSDGNLDIDVVIKLALESNPVIKEIFDKVKFATEKIDFIANKTSSLNSLLLATYGFYKKFSSFYVLDNTSFLSKKFTWGNRLITTSMLPVLILKKLAGVNFSDIKLVDNLIENVNDDDAKKGLSELGERLKNVFTDNWFADIISLYLDNEFLARNLGWLGNSAFNIGSSFAYYNLYAKHKLGQNDLWPNDFNHLNNAVWKSLFSGSISAANYLGYATGLNGISLLDKAMLLAPESMIASRKNAEDVEINKQKLEETKRKIFKTHLWAKKIENNSLGIIGPDLMQFLATTFVPVLTEKYFPKNIANLDKNTVFVEDLTKSSDKLKKVKNFFKSYRPLTFDYYVGNKNLSAISREEYVRNKMLGYASQKVGRHVGRKVGLRYKNIVNRFSAKMIVKLFDSWFVSNDGYEMFVLENAKDLEKLSDLDKKVFFIKRHLRDSIPILFSLREVNPQAKMAYELLINSLLYTSTFTSVELAQLELDFKTGENLTDERLDNFLDRILNSISGTISQKIGGIVGGYVSKAATNYVVNSGGGSGGQSGGEGQVADGDTQ